MGQIPVLQRPERLDPRRRGKLERGPVRFDIGPGGPVAYQAYFAAPSLRGNGAGVGQRGGTAIAWAPDARCKEAWSNLLGATVPAPPGSAQSGRLDEARRWLQQADSALRIGDWSEFGRAWGSLRSVLGLPLDSARF